MATRRPSDGAGLTGLTGLSALLQRHWWRPRPTLLARALQPLSWLYAALSSLRRAMSRPQRATVPVLVVGNVVLGGAGKTPTVLAALQLLKDAGHRPAVLSRGYGRLDKQARRVAADDTPELVGDEPLLIHRRSGVPVWVGPDRAALSRLACQTDPRIDVLVCDDGLQHHRLARDVNLIVFDERGVGNGLLLPAGPLRQHMQAPHPEPGAVPVRVLYNAAAASTAMPGALAQRSISRAWPLKAWWQNEAAQAVSLAQLQGRPLLAAAGLAAPEKFFLMLEAAGLQINRLPLPDHHAFDTLPWPATTAEVVVTEKDAIKLQPAQLQAAGATTTVWVVPLDFSIPEALGRELLALLFTPGTPP